MKTSVTGKVPLLVHIARVDTFSNECGGFSIKYSHHMMRTSGSRKISLIKAWRFTLPNTLFKKRLGNIMWTRT